MLRPMQFRSSQGPFNGLAANIIDEDLLGPNGQRLVSIEGPVMLTTGQVTGRAPLGSFDPLRPYYEGGVGLVRGADDVPQEFGVRAFMVIVPPVGKPYTYPVGGRLLLPMDGVYRVGAVVLAASLTTPIAMVDEPMPTITVEEYVPRRLTSIVTDDDVSHRVPFWATHMTVLATAAGLGRPHDYEKVTLGAAGTTVDLAIALNDVRQRARYVEVTNAQDPTASSIDFVLTLDAGGNVLHRVDPNAQPDDEPIRLPMGSNVRTVRTEFLFASTHAVGHTFTYPETDSTPELEILMARGTRQYSGHDEIDVHVQLGQRTRLVDRTHFYTTRSGTDEHALVIAWDNSGDPGEV